MVTPEHARQVIETYCTAETAKDRDTWLSLFTPDATHEDLMTKLDPTIDLTVPAGTVGLPIDDCGHGSAMAGLVAAATNNNTGVAILELVPEGTFVEEGDFLVRLDDSTLQNDLQLQQITCNSSAAVLIQAKTAVETATLATRHGTRVQGGLGYTVDAASHLLFNRVKGWSVLAGDPQAQLVTIARLVADSHVGAPSEG